MFISSDILLMPVFVQVALTFFLLFWMGAARNADIKANPALLQKSANDLSVWQGRTRQIGACLRNQFEMPILFYAVIAFALLTAAESLLMVILAWAFVLSRLVHAVIHTGANQVMPRFIAFIMGVLALMVMWGLVAWNLYVGGGMG